MSARHPMCDVAIESSWSVSHGQRGQGATLEIWAFSFLSRGSHGRLSRQSMALTPTNVTHHTGPHRPQTEHSLPSRPCRPRSRSHFPHRTRVALTETHTHPRFDAQLLATGGEGPHPPRHHVLGSPRRSRVPPPGAAPSTLDAGAWSLVAGEHYQSEKQKADGCLSICFLLPIDILGLFRPPWGFQRFQHCEASPKLPVLPTIPAGRSCVSAAPIRQSPGGRGGTRGGSN